MDSNPKKVWLRFLAPLLLVVFLAIPVVAWWAYHRTITIGYQNQANSSLAQIGMEVQATITGVSQVLSYSVNQQHPYVITAVWADPNTGKVYNFKSDWLLQNPVFALKNQTTISVYLDKSNYSRYYLEVPKY